MLLALVEALDALGEPLVAVVGFELAHAALRRLDHRAAFAKSNVSATRLDLAEQLRLLGAPTLDLVGNDRLLLRALGLLDLLDDLARALADRLVLGLLRDVLEPIDVVELLDRGESDFLERRVDRDRAEHVAVVDARDRGEPQVLWRIALGELGQRARIAQLAERALAERGERRVHRDLDQRVLVAELDDSGQRVERVLLIIVARGTRPQLSRTFARVVAQAPFGLGRGDVREHGGFFDLPIAIRRTPMSRSVRATWTRMAASSVVKALMASVRTRTSLWRYLGRKRSAIPMGGTQSMRPDRPTQGPGPAARPAGPPCGFCRLPGGACSTRPEAFRALPSAGPGPGKGVPGGV